MVITVTHVMLWSIALTLAALLTTVPGTRRGRLMRFWYVFAGPAILCLVGAFEAHRGNVKAATIDIAWAGISFLIGLVIITFKWRG